MFIKDKNIIRKNIVGDDRGFVMVVALSLLLVLTIIGIAAINSTTVENMQAGNVRSKTESFYNAEPGSQVAQEIVEQSSGLKPDIKGFESYIAPAFSDPKALQKALRIFSHSSTTNDSVLNFDGSNDSKISVGLNKMYNCDYQGGGSRAYGFGYSGVAVTAPIITCYRINSTCRSDSGAEATVASVYQRVAWE